VTEVFPLDVAAAGRARRLVADRLDAWDMAALSGSLALAASELVTNAVRYGRGPIVVRLEARDDRVRLEVEDRGGGRPAVQPVDPTGHTVGGWGLRMVDQVVDAWGAEVGDHQTLVWVELTLQPPATGPS
jgi:anti-sigma regulatory factor (Ser/Thr protein kinase)